MTENVVIVANVEIFSIIAEEHISRICQHTTEIEWTISPIHFQSVVAITSKNEHRLTIRRNLNVVWAVSYLKSAFLIIGKFINVICCRKIILCNNTTTISNIEVETVRSHKERLRALQRFIQNQWISSLESVERTTLRCERCTKIPSVHLSIVTKNEENSSIIIEGDRFRSYIQRIMPYTSLSIGIIITSTSTLRITSLRNAF